VSSTSTARTELTTPLGEPVRRTPVDGWTLAGIAIAVLTTVAGIASTGVSLRYFLQPTAVWIVLGGTLGVTLVTTPRNSLHRINADSLATVSAIADVLGKIPNNVSLVGHADAVPIHNRRFASNWELAAARGLRLLELLSSRYGIAESRLSVQSYGSYDARSPNDTPDGRANNRRVEIVILDATPRATP
jgi:OmpA family